MLKSDLIFDMFFFYRFGVDLGAILASVLDGFSMKTYFGKIFLKIKLLRFVPFHHGNITKPRPDHHDDDHPDDDHHIELCPVI